MSGNPAGRGVAKVLGINLDYRNEEPIASAAASISSIETCKLSSYVPLASVPDSIQMLKMNRLSLNGRRNSGLQPAHSNDTCAACFHFGIGFSITT